MKGILKHIMLFSTALLSASCGELLLDSDNGGVDMAVNRTVLVYMAADNNLALYARKNIEDMKQGEVPSYFDEGSGDVLLVYADIDGEEPRLMRLSKDRFGVVTEETLRVYEEWNSCTDSVMSAVLSDTVLDGSPKGITAIRCILLRTEAPRLRII